MRRTGNRVCAVTLFALALSTPAALAQTAATLPGGATSLNETHGDWVVACAQQDDRKACSIAQTQTDSRTNQRVLGIELRPPTGENVEGVLVMPFGLQLDSGVSIQVDDAAPRNPLRFKTCLPAGCIVPLSLDSEIVEALRTGTTLKLNAAASDSAKPVTFSVSLKGFTGALDRAVELAK